MGRSRHLARSSDAARLLADAETSARAAHLRYVLDEETPGIRRLRTRSPRRFRFLDEASGAAVTDEATLARIDALKIPPAWDDVWICRDARGHIQATGRDARGRKQYRYHPRWRDVRDATKFEKTLDFAHALPRLRARVSEDLGRHHLSRERVIATAVRLLDTTLIRIGNDEYARANDHYGLTTLRRRHVRLHGDEVAFRFAGKSGKERVVSVRDPRVARVVRRCVELPGQLLFQYRDGEGALHAVHSHDVNEYLREATGDDFTAKDFRTWAATVLAGLALRRICSGAAPPRSVERQIVAAVRGVAEVLGNTPAVCRRSYVHPLVLDGHREGALLDALDRELGRRARRPIERGLRPEEAAVLGFLRARLSAARGAASIEPLPAHRGGARPRSKGRRSKGTRREAARPARGAPARSRRRRCVDR